MSYPTERPRRLRRTAALRQLVRERRLAPAQLVPALFAVHGTHVRRPIDELPGNAQLSVDELAEEAAALWDLGVRAVLLFGVPKKKDETGSEALAEDGIQARAIAAVKRRVPELIVVADTCMSMFTPHGHSGLVREGRLLNDESLESLCQIALTQARAGADMVAPSAMLDGQIGALRRALDGGGFADTCIMAYAAKYASCLYDPFFRQGQKGDTGNDVDYELKQTHQMDIPNGDEALREIALDLREGADVVMVKPGLWYLDVVWRAKEKFGAPLAVYNVSGECAMLAAAAKEGMIDFDRAVSESMQCCVRAGADMIVTYFARQVIDVMMDRA